MSIHLLVCQLVMIKYIGLIALLEVCFSSLATFNLDSSAFCALKFAAAYVFYMNGNCFDMCDWQAKQMSWKLHDAAFCRIGSTSKHFALLAV